MIRSGNNETYEKEHIGSWSGLMNECKLQGHTNTRGLTNYTRENRHYIKETLHLVPDWFGHPKYSTLGRKRLLLTIAIWLAISEWKLDAKYPAITGPPLHTFGAFVLHLYYIWCHIRTSVSSDIQTLWNRWKTIRKPSFLLLTSKCFDIWWNSFECLI